MIDMEASDITIETKCLKPCSYKKYKFMGDPSYTGFVSDFFVLSVLAVSNATIVETEELIYQLSELVADFGGTLGLFLGVSFITVWDGALYLKNVLSK